MVIDNFNFNFYGLFLFSAIIIGYLYIYYSLLKEKVNRNNIKYYFLLYISFVLVFGKLFTMIFSKESDFISASFSSYGGVIGVILSAYIFEKMFLFNNKLLKYSIMSLPLIYSISKIGCFLAGCCFGIPYNGLLSVTYKNGLNIQLFPVQMIETIIFFIIFFFVNKYKKNKNIVYYTILISAFSKYMLDYLRYEHLNKIISINQIISLLIILSILIIVIYKKKKDK